MSGLLAAARLIGGVNDVLLRICRYLIIAIVALLTVILILAVFYRYALNDAISWSEEGSKYLMIWLTFIGAPIALRHHGHVSIDLLVHALPARISQALLFFIQLVIIATMTVLLIKGLGFTQMGARQVASSFNFSMQWMYAAVPIGSGLLILVAVEHALLALVGMRDPASGLVQDDGNMAAGMRE